MQHAYPSQIRAMRLEDLDAVLAVQAVCYPPSMQEAGAVLRARIHAAADTCVVAEDGNGICGYLFAYPSSRGLVTPLGAEFAPARDADTLYLHDLAVMPRAHGRGLARRMAAHLLEQAQSRGFAWSALVSVQDTAGFWSTLGYRIDDAASPAARTALAGYPGLARYMVRTLTGRGAPSPNC